MATSPERTIIIVGGEMHTTPIATAGDHVIAADSGYDHALRLDLSVDHLVGDLDSISSIGIEHAERADITIDRHPPDKDETDLEIALRTAIDNGATSIDIYGAEGGGLGHLLGVALAMTHERCSFADVTWHTVSGTVRVAFPDRAVTLPSRPDDRVTLLPVGSACGVSTKGLQWSLDHDCLETGSTRGVSNRAISTTVVVEVCDGSVLVIHEKRGSA